MEICSNSWTSIFGAPTHPGKKKEVKDYSKI